MPKDRRVRSSSFDLAMVSPYSCCSKIPDHNNSNSSSTHAGDEKEWEEARCPICMEHPHNAVLLLCSSCEKGCRPFICDTSYRHSNCLDQFRKSAAASSSQIQSEKQQYELVCPLCRGLVTGWEIIHPARKFMNSKTRSCSLETCTFSGNYAELRKHARQEHPCECPSEASPTRQSNWAVLEQQREIEDALAHQSDTEYDFDGWPSLDEWVEDDFWSDGSFFDFPSGMSDIEDQMMDEMFSGLSLSLFSLYSSSPEDETMDSGSSRSSDRPQRSILSTNSNSRLNSHMGNTMHGSRSRSNFHRENGSVNVNSRSDYGRENGSVNVNSRSDYGRENGSANVNSRSDYGRENDSANVNSRSDYGRENGPRPLRMSSFDRENGSTNLNLRSRGYHRGNESTNLRSISSFNQQNGSASLSSRSVYHRENDLTNSRSIPSYHRGNSSANLSSRSVYHRENTFTSYSSRSGNLRENSSTVAWRGLSYHRQNGSSSSRTRSSYDRDDNRPSSRSGSRFYPREVTIPVRRGHIRRSSTQAQSRRRD